VYDSLYHAAAIVEGGTFLTADAKHAAKTRQYGHLQLLGTGRRRRRLRNKDAAVDRAIS
jgi:hypothetical protein